MNEIIETVLPPALAVSTILGFLFGLWEVCHGRPYELPSRRPARAQRVRIF